MFTRIIFKSKHEGPWICHYCGRPLEAHKVTLDHVLPQSKYPEFRYVLANLTVACENCNRKKKDREHDDFPHTCHTEISVLV